ncbi:OmpH family outer membrane protein [Rhodovulum strictum]|uniref:OmpH family outer membrane protein n=1 Tax=Rhodovulum strictum TaxID=58314 RepID=A0A844BH23_9RHOB|nr:OmpH family outer membrane protein [Rhodovulum strictum]MRH20352.1 OmpH family outer membrane protein [Rhodovulum strictum]
MRQARAAVLAGLLAGLAAMPCSAQDAQMLRSPVLTLDQERLLADSRAGRALAEALEAATGALGAENRQIEAELIAEERDLTERRRTLPPEEFRALAEAFDEKVVAIRRAQDAKARALSQRRELDQQAFYRQALPLVAEIVRERGGVVVLERGAVILSAEQVDITDEAIAAIDARLAPEAAEPAGTGPEPGTDAAAE